MRRTSLLSLALAGGLALAAPLQAQAPAAPVDSLALARQFTQWFYQSQWDSLLAHAPADHRPSAAELKERHDMLTARAGAELWVLDEKFVMRNGRPQYWRTAQFTAMKDPILLRWVIDPQGQIIGMGLGPASQAPPIDPPAGAAATPKQ